MLKMLNAEMKFLKKVKKIYSPICEIKKIYTFAPSLAKRHKKVLTRGVIGNTSGFGPEEFRFEP